MRRFLTPRWLKWHALMVVLVVTFCVLGWWQWLRGESGNLRSFGYAFEWPAFAIFVIVFWVRMIRDELHPPEQAEPRPPPPYERQHGEQAVTLPEDEREQADEDPELAAYNAYLARLNAVASSNEHAAEGTSE